MSQPINWFKSLASLTGEGFSPPLNQALTLFASLTWAAERRLSG